MTWTLNCSSVSEENTAALHNALKSLPDKSSVTIYNIRHETEAEIKFWLKIADETCRTIRLRFYKRIVYNALCVSVELVKRAISLCDADVMQINSDEFSIRFGKGTLLVQMIE